MNHMSYEDLINSFADLAVQAEMGTDGQGGRMTRMFLEMAMHGQAEYRGITFDQIASDMAAALAF